MRRLRLLVLIWDVFTESEEVTIAELAERANISRSSATRTVNALVQMDYLAEKPQSDNRQRTLVLTDSARKGIDMWAEYFEEWNRAIKKSKGS